MNRKAILVTHTGRPGAIAHARRVAAELSANDFIVQTLASETSELGLPEERGVTAASPDAEIVLALGGDGTVLRAAELARPAGVPLLGVNFGRMGFLTAAETDDLDEVLRRVISRDYHVEERLTIDARVHPGGHAPETDQDPVREWALNEISLERGPKSRMLEVLLKVDDHAVSHLGCDGIITATPTGSTAYAFSAGGPVVWPHVQVLLVVPVSAHALFSRPLLAGPESVISLTIGARSDAVLVADGRRTVELKSGDEVLLCRGEHPIRVVQLERPNFAQRLVAKFQLPVAGWRHETPERTE